ncbi:MAG: hypothetical protein MZV63_14190 [Marinilabiliales bacterium]|nr:hypothetical protein [Marinilabiliales bacterium]
MSIPADLRGRLPAFVGSALQGQFPLSLDDPQRQGHEDDDRQEDGDKEERDLLPATFSNFIGGRNPD